MKMNQNTAGRKIFLGLLTALMLIGTSALAQEVREVTFWSAHGEPDLSVIRSIVESFNEEHADINVTLPLGK
jgi:ABC-type glycerol-3-phosphate transport system substrate-binding protein